MALIYEGVACPLCDKEIDLNSPIFATSGVFFPLDHPLCVYCDAPMHWECYERWPDRREFARGHFQMHVEEEPENPYWGKAFLSEDVLVTVNPSPHVAEVSVCLAETCSDIRVPLKLWSLWIRSKWIVVPWRHPLEEQALRKVWPLLRKALPRANDLVKAVDWAAKQEVLNRDKERTRQSEEERLRKPRAHNKACRSLLRRGVHCPYCNSDRIQYVDQSPEAKSYFLCGHCGQSFGPVEVTLKHLYDGNILDDL